MTLQQLKYIVTVAECGSLSDAAKSLFISQPSLSNAVKEVETMIGKALFFRTSRGMELTEDGAEFIGYARQVLQQMEMLDDKYLKHKNSHQRFCVSTQHYTFAANAFVELIRRSAGSAYEFTLYEGTTYDIIQNVRSLRSELGIIYLSNANEIIMQKIFKDNDLVFEPLFTAQPHVFLFRDHPLADRDMINLEDLAPYPCISYDQGLHNSFYFSEEILPARNIDKKLHVNDRATATNFIIGLNAYTISSGVFPEDIHGKDIISVKLKTDEKIEVGAIMHKDMILSELGHIYLKELRNIVLKL